MTDQQKRPLSPSDHIPVREHSVLRWSDILYMGERERIHSRYGVGFVYGGQEKQTVGDKLSGLRFTPAYPCPSGTNDFSLVPFQSWKRVLFFLFRKMPNWYLHVFSPVKGDAVGVVLKNLTFHSLLLQLAQGAAKLLQTHCPSCMFTKKKKKKPKQTHFLKTGAKILAF